MSHEIDLSKFSVRTDIVIDKLDDFNSDEIIHNERKIDNISVSEIVTKSDNKVYKTITFDDITDKDNFKKVEGIVAKELSDVLHRNNINLNMSSLIIGLGNIKSTPDSLGPKVLENTLVTRYLFDLGEVEEGYSKTSIFSPGVTGTTGIETRDLIKGVVEVSKPDFLIVIDALAASKVSRVNKVIQITDAGILPGSGVGNSRKEINKETFKIPVIAIGIPTIVDAATICYDAFNYMKKKFAYKIENINSFSHKFINPMKKNYLNTKKELTMEEKTKFLGLIGTLDDKDIKKLLLEVLSPIDSNLMVTPKEIDFVIDKLALLLGNSINKVLHKKYNSTN